tara:strand:+ start:99 stop:824 length:726 start_codon:yes stop_codon:yes gene_type:complete
MFNLGSFLEGPSYAVLNEIFAQFRGDEGYARPTRFDVLLLPPNGGGSSPGNINVFHQQLQQFASDGTVRNTGIKCKSIQFPGRTLDVQEDTNIYGPVRSIVNGYSYGDVSASFYCSSDLKEKRLFETWQRLAYNPQTWAMGYYKDYVGEIRIHQLDENDNMRYGVALTECFPKDIQSQQLDASTTNSVTEITVTFSYRYWKSLKDEANLPKPLGNSIQETLENVVERQVSAAIPSVLRKLF